MRDLLGIFENARRRRGEIQLSRGRTLHLRQFGKREFRVAERVARAPACSLDEPRGESLLVVEKDLQNMFGRELLVTLADGERLSALNEAARPLGIFFHIHDGYLPFAKLLLTGRHPRTDAGKAGTHGGNARARRFGVAVRGKPRRPLQPPFARNVGEKCVRGRVLCPRKDSRAFSAEARW